MTENILEKFGKYMGARSKPADFDGFWEESIALADSLPLDVSITLADFPSPVVDCFDLYFTGTNNARVYAKLLAPKCIKDKAPALLTFHGYGGSSVDFSLYMQYAASGFVVAALDCRGQAGKSEYGDVSVDKELLQAVQGLNLGREHLTYRHIYLDVYLVAKIVKNLPYVDSDRLGVYGGSQGGALSLICASLVPEIKRAAPAFPYLCDFSGEYSTLAESYFEKYDPERRHEDEIYEMLGYIDVKNFTSRIKGEVMFATALRDVVCPVPTQLAAYNAIRSKKRLEVFPNHGHESLPGWDDMNYQFFLPLLK